MNLYETECTVESQMRSTRKNPFNSPPPPFPLQPRTSKSNISAPKIHLLCCHRCRYYFCLLLMITPANASAHTHNNIIAGQRIHKSYRLTDTSVRVSRHLAKALNVNLNLL